MLRYTQQFLLRHGELSENHPQNNSGIPVSQGHWHRGRSLIKINTSQVSVSQQKWGYIRQQEKWKEYRVVHKVPPGSNTALCNFQAYVFYSIIFQENEGYQNDCYYPQHLVTEKEQGCVPRSFLQPSRISTQGGSFTSLIQPGGVYWQQLSSTK